MPGNSMNRNGSNRNGPPRAARHALLRLAAAAGLVVFGFAGPAVAATAATARSAVGKPSATPFPVAPVLSSPTARALTAAFAAFKHIPARDVAGVQRGSLHLTYDRATKTYWAAALFAPANRDSAAVLVSFQDAGRSAVFSRHGRAGWRMVTYVGTQPAACSISLPSSVRRAWGGTSSLCNEYIGTHVGSKRPTVRAGLSTVSGTAIADIAVEQAQEGIGDTPPSDKFSLDCNPYTTMVDAGASTVGCGVDPTFGVQDENEEWCADFTKWVWEQGGVSTDLSALTPGAASFYQWALNQGQNPEWDGGTPQVGDAIVFYPNTDTAPNSSLADHVGIVVGVNSDGTVNLVNGDFGGNGVDITVEENDDVNILPWASAIWGSGENYILVSPGAAPATAYAVWKGGPDSGYNLWEGSGPANGSLSGPSDRGMGPLNSAPALAVGPNGYLYAYWEGGPNSGNALWEAYWNGSSWQGPFDRGMGPLNSQPTVAVSANGTAYVFWEGGPGSGNALFEANGPATGALAGPYKIGMGPLNSAPTAGIDDHGNIAVYWEGGPDSGNALWEAYWNGSSWGGPYNRGMGPLNSQPTVAVSPSGTAYVFWEGGPDSGNALFQAQGPASGSLSGPYNRGMGPLDSAPSAGVDANGNTYVYWEGGPDSGNALWEAYWNGSAWVGPYNRGMGPLGSQPAVAVFG
jgi:hypothetical protein